MRRCFRSKLKKQCGLARIHVILLCLCAILLVLLLLPTYRKYRYHGQWLACEDSLRVVNGALVVTMLSNGQTDRLNDAATELVSILPGRDGYCPSGGTVYFLKGENGEWRAVCGMHDSDHAERTRLNASYVLKQVREKVRQAVSEGDPDEGSPQEVTVELNGEKLACRLVSGETGIRRGTSTTDGYEGTVAFYGLEGSGSFAGTGAGQGEVCYFCFANEEYNADWRAGDGWTGSSYGDRY